MLRLLPGPGVRLTTTERGTIISYDGLAASYQGPFHPTLSAGDVFVSPGFVNGFEPKIGKIPLSGGEKHEEPRLTLDPAVLEPNADRTWISIEVEVDDDGRMTEETRLEIVHRPDNATRDNRDGVEIGVQPIALVIWAGKQPSRVLPVVHHNLAYARTFPAPGDGVPRHFFWAV